MRFVCTVIVHIMILYILLCNIDNVLRMKCDGKKRLRDRTT